MTKYYIAFEIENTDLHLTVAYNDIGLSEEQLDQVCASSIFHKTQGRKLGVYGTSYLDGPNGEPNQVKTIKVTVLDEGGEFEDLDAMTSIKEFTMKWAHRSYLDEQYSFKLHISVPKDIDTTNLVIGKPYIKNLTTKEKKYIEDK